jgi:putative addiction module component (TIGR02574 family)
MSESVERLKPELARLSGEERTDLACFLLVSLDDTEFDADELTDLLDRRSEKLRSGAAEAIPAEQLFARLRTGRR